MMISMFRLGHYSEVFRTIVRFVSVDVVSLLIALKRTTKLLFKNKAMLHYFFPAAIYDDVASRAKALATFPVAILLAAINAICALFESRAFGRTTKLAESMWRCPEFRLANTTSFESPRFLRFTALTTATRGMDNNVLAHCLFFPAIAAAKPSSSLSIPSDALKNDQFPESFSNHLNFVA